MGWKTIKTEFEITRHIVYRDRDRILISSGYIPDIITIAPDGVLTAKSGYNDMMKKTFPKLIGASQAQIHAAFHAPDHFERSLPVYTYEGGEIIEKKCETYGWPNVTHDGDIMYENSFFSDRDKAIETALRVSRAAEKNYREREAEILKNLETIRAMKTEAAENTEKLTHLASSSMSHTPVPDATPAP